MDEIADIIATALRATKAALTPSGISQARFVIDDKIGSACRERCLDLLTRFPLYPQIEL
jgi:hypothetical protein